VDHRFMDESDFQAATKFSCKSFYAMQFHALRRLYYGGDRKYVESLCQCEEWKVTGGKSGAGFMKTKVCISIPYYPHYFLKKSFIWIGSTLYC